MKNSTSFVVNKDRDAYNLPLPDVQNHTRLTQGRGFRSRNDRGLEDYSDEAKYNQRMAPGMPARAQMIIIIQS